MSENKIKKGIYYSCPHQELSKSSCNACASEAERKREEMKENNKHLPIPAGEGIKQTQVIDCELCQAQIAECYTETDNKEKKYTIHTDDCYRDNHRSEKSCNEYFACSNCKDKYQKLVLCPWCQGIKEDFDNPSCKQCRYGKNPQELHQKYEKYKQGVMSGSNQIKSNQIKSNQIKSNQIKSNQIQIQSTKILIKPIIYLEF